MKKTTAISKLLFGVHSNWGFDLSGMYNTFHYRGYKELKIRNDEGLIITLLDKIEKLQEHIEEVHKIAITKSYHRKTRKTTKINK